MKLSKLIKDIDGIEVQGPKSVEITGICINSKRVGPGNLFIAKKGSKSDGNDFIPEALNAGAAALLTDIYNPSLKGVTQLITDNIAALEGALVAEYYQHASDELLMVGVTGTKGKTTTSYLIQHLLQQTQLPCGMLGTVEYVVGTHRYPAQHTTPDLVSNHRMLREMVNQGCRACVMEVSSHGLVQGRVDKINYDIAVFTNLSPDHLDYHPTMEAYQEAKRQLFLSLGDNTTAVVNVDVAASAHMLKGIKAAPFTYGIDSKADLQAIDLHHSDRGSTFNVLWQGRSYPVRLGLLGRHNVYNALAAVGAGLAAGKSIDTLIAALEAFGSVPGRLELVQNALGLKIFVDFAHTEESLAQVLKGLRPLLRGRLITLFGAGGDRDPGRRTGMARSVEQYSDLAVVTSDNPRSEDPQKIISDILKGFKDASKVTSEIDRGKAIEMAVAMATPDDILLIAGKGHEKTQIFAHQTVPFDDCKVAKEACEKVISASL